MSGWGAHLQTSHVFLCTSRYDDVCVGLVGKVLLYPSLCAPYPFFRTSMTSLLSPPLSLGHTSTHGRSISVFRPLFLYFPRFLLLLLLFPFIPLAYALTFSVAERIANLAGVDTPLSLLARFCHFNRLCTVQPRTHGLTYMYAKIVRKQKGERRKRRVYARKWKAIFLHGKRSERCSSKEEKIKKLAERSERKRIHMWELKWKISGQCGVYTYRKTLSEANGWQRVVYHT